MTTGRKIITQATVWILTLLASLFYAPLIAAKYQLPIPVFISLSLFFLILLPLLAGVLQYICYKKCWDRNYFIRIPILMIAVVFYLPNLQDDELIETGWSLDEFTSTDPELLKSYDQLQIFMDLGDDLTVEDSTGVLKRRRQDEFDYSNPENQKKLEICWQENSLGLAEFAKLNKFEQIFSYKHQEFILAKRTIGIELFRYYIFLYTDRAQLKAAQGEMDQAIRLLGEAHTILRKIAPNTVCSIESLICYAMFSETISTANKLIERSSFNPQHAKQLSMYFPALTNEVDLKRMCVNECLGLEQALARAVTTNGYKEKFFYKKNRTFNIGRKYWMLAAAEADVTPFDFPTSEAYFNEVSSTIDPTNFVGWSVMTQIGSLVIEGLAKVGLKTKVESQIFRLNLAEKCDEQLSILDPYTNQPYKKDEQGDYRSAGADQKYFTDDDIMLTNKKNNKKRGK